MLSDYSGKLTPETSRQLETLLRNFRDRSGIEVATALVPFEYLKDYPIEEYALQLGRQWGVGRGAQKEALLLLVAVKQPDSRGVYSGGSRLEVSRRLEGDIPDGLAGEIIRRMRDDLRAGRFDQALTTGVQTVLATIAQKRNISLEGINRSYAYQPAERPARRSRGFSPFTIIIIIFVIFSILSMFGGGGGRGGRRYGRRGSGIDWILLPLIFGSGSGWGGRSGGSSGWGGGGGGDFGGFGGGGDFGGGGASDSW
jgi:uncharacterized protein